MPGVPRLQSRMPGRRGYGALKSEFLAGYWTRHGTPLRARALANVERLASHGAAGSRHCPIGLHPAGPIRWLNECSGHRPQEAASRWKRNTFERWLVENKQPAAPNAEAGSCFSTTRS